MNERSLPGSGWTNLKRDAARLVGLASLLLFIHACAWETVTLDDGPDRAAPPSVEIEPLPIGSPVSGVIDCPAGRCDVRYRIEVMDAGQLALTLTPAGKPQWIRMTLKSPMQEVVGQARTEEGAPLVLEQFVPRGPHTVLVQSIGEPAEFEIVARVSHGEAPDAMPAQPSRSIRDRCLEEAPRFCAGVADEAECIRKNRAGCWERFGGKD